MINIIKTIAFLSTILIFTRCKNQNNNEIIEKEYSSFVYIDMSFSDGWTNYYSLKLFRNGKMYVFNNEHRKGNLYYGCTINDNELDSICKIVNVLLKSSIDSLYKSSCQDCASYNLIIKTNDKKFRSLVEDMNSNDNNIKQMNDLASFLYHILQSSKSSIDTVFNFESKIAIFSRDVGSVTDYHMTK